MIIIMIIINHLLCQALYKLIWASEPKDVGSVMISLFLKRLRHRVVRELASGHNASKWLCKTSKPIHLITKLYQLAVKITAVNILVNILLDQSLCVYKHIFIQYKEIKLYMLFYNPLFKFNNMPWAAFHVSNYIPNFSFLMAAHHNSPNLIPTGHLNFFL